MYNDEVYNNGENVDVLYTGRTSGENVMGYSQQKVIHKRCKNEKH